MIQLKQDNITDIANEGENMMDTLETYINMLSNKNIDMSIFSEAGFNECPVDGKLTLAQYVKDCHDWWFALVENFTTIDILYSKEKNTGAVICEVTYIGSFTLPFVQYMTFDQEGKILTLASFWNVERLRKEAKTNPALRVLFPENRVHKISEH